MKNKHCIVFIASQEYENLGIGYMASVLMKDGFAVRSLNYRQSKYKLAAAIRKYNPLIVGFSVIFQYNIDIFIDIISYFRKKGIECHFTAGGHYASLKPEELFSYIPHLDSIVRFEGENTMLELARSMARKTGWKMLDGISWHNNGRVINNKPRPLEKNISSFPFPYRRTLKKFAFELPAATILAGRGCIHNCCFCNTREFYRTPGGPIKRIRNPESVVDEIEQLYHKRDCPIFLFIDDDFPVSSSNGEWTDRFSKELEKRSLSKKIIWKICCRPDEISEGRISWLKEHGLFLVFLGIEDGTAEGLKRLNKKTSVIDIKTAVKILKSEDVGIEFGFLLFQPWTTFKSLNKNLEFLREICGDGYMPVSYNKVMPFYETQLEKDLMMQGRLNLTPGRRDYNFQDPRIDDFYDFITSIFARWSDYRNGLQNACTWMNNYLLVYKAFFGKDQEYLDIEKQVRAIISKSNNFIIDIHLEMSGCFESDQYSPVFLAAVKNSVAVHQSRFVSEINKLISDLYLLAMNRALFKLMRNN